MDDETNNGFIRQRRNLILICLILGFVEFAEVKFEKLNLLGNERTISNPRIVSISLWVAFFYWLLRYFQYFNAIHDKGIEKAYISKLDSALPKVTLKRYIKATDLSKIFPGIGAIPQLSIDSHETKNRHPDFWNIRITLDATANDGKGAAGNTKTGLDVQPFSKAEMRIPKINAWTSIIFTSHLFTEYFLPFLLAIAILGSKLWLILN
jgi:hypothetical protein